MQCNLIRGLGLAQSWVEGLPRSFHGSWPPSKPRKQENQARFTSATVMLQYHAFQHKRGSCFQQHWRKSKYKYSSQAPNTQLARMEIRSNFSCSLSTILDLPRNTIQIQGGKGGSNLPQWSYPLIIKDRATTIKAIVLASILEHQEEKHKMAEQSNGILTLLASNQKEG